MNAHLKNLKKALTTIGTLLSAIFFVWGLLSCTAGTFGPGGAVGIPGGALDSTGSVGGSGTQEGESAEGGSQILSGQAAHIGTISGPDPQTDYTNRPKYILAACSTLLEINGCEMNENTNQCPAVNPVIGGRLKVRLRGHVFGLDNPEDETEEYKYCCTGKKLKIQYVASRPSFGFGEGVETIKEVQIPLTNEDGKEGFFDITLDTALNPDWKFWLEIRVSSPLTKVPFEVAQLQTTENRSVKKSEGLKVTSFSGQNSSPNFPSIYDQWYPIIWSFVQNDGFPSEFDQWLTDPKFNQCGGDTLLDKASVMSNIYDGLSGEGDN